MEKIGRRKSDAFLLNQGCSEIFRRGKKKNSIFFFEGICTKSGQKYGVRVYGVLGDSPALKLALCHISHVGYHCCYYCEIKGVHTDGKRQYYYDDDCVLRTSKSFLSDSQLAESQNENIKGRLGVSIFHRVLDIPLPYSCIADYLHVTLLRHGRTLYHHLYNKHLKPIQRTEFDQKLANQRYPHFFNRKVRSVKEPFLK